MLISKNKPAISSGERAMVHLNNKRVGVVIVRGSSNSWTWGEFEAEPSFAEFAPLFGIWSLVMHADEGGKRLSRAASEELRQAETALDQLRCRLYWPQQDAWTRVGQVNIDDHLIEWKQD